MRLAVDATGALVDELGYQAVTARAIAGRIGYTPGTLYSHFSNLDDVFLHVNLMSLKQLRLDWGQLITGDRSPEELLRTMGHAYLRFATERPRRFELLIHAQVPGSGALPGYVQQNVDQLKRLIASQLLRIQLDPAGVEENAGAVLAAMHGVCVLALPGQLLTATWCAQDATMDFVVTGCIERAREG